MATAKKAAKSTAKKSAAKKAVASGKPAAKKVVASNKPAAKKSVASNKPAAKKSVASNKPAAKKSVASSKPVAKKSAPATKSTTKKAPVSPAAKKAAKSPFGKKFVDEMKERLVNERVKYLHSAEEYRAEADALIEGREPGDVQFDEESGEGDTLAVERERDLALSAQARAAVEQIDAALARIEAGTYGVCVASGLAIPQERLRAIPWAAERVEYKVGGLGRR